MGSPSNADSRTAVAKLTDVAKRQGFVTPDDIADVIPDEAALDEDFIDRIYTGLAEAGVEMREDAQDEAPITFESLANERRRGANTADGAGDSDDTLSLFLRDIGGIALLTGDEERDLARRFELGREAHSRLAVDPNRLKDAERAVLRRQVDDGERARERLNNANLRLVVHIAKKYVNHGVPFEDLIQDGCLGLIKATEKFDWRRGHKFSTYATWWIRQSITRALADQSRTIRVPVHMTEQISRVRAVMRQLEQELGGRSPTLSEIGNEMGLTPQRVEEILQYASIPVSLESPVNEDSDSEYGEFLDDKDTPEPNEEANRELLREELAAQLGSLSQREAEVLARRYGLLDGTPQTLEEVGEKLGVTRERIRQIETKAIRRLRHPTRSSKLREYLR